ncbi:class I SAM-dependent methyltransferase, partial [Chloroflexota bacterium]
NFSIDYDWFINVDVAGFWENKDIYDTCSVNTLERYIVKKPEYTFTCGLDYKTNLLAQAESLGLYENLVLHDANQILPFEDSTFNTVFSNILYWLNEPLKSLREIHRVLQDKGRVLLCIPNVKFTEYCFTYSWEEKKSSLLMKLNRGRSKVGQWFASYDEFSELSKKVGFSIADHSYYLSRLTLAIWDIGLRPISPYLIQMANKLGPEDRRAIKLEWVDTLGEILVPLYGMEMNSQEEGGFHFFVLQKR